MSSSAGGEDRTVRGILELIAEGAGPFSTDPLKHAENTIEHQKKLAREGLKLLDKETPEDSGERPEYPEGPSPTEQMGHGLTLLTEARSICGSWSSQNEDAREAAGMLDGAKREISEATRRLQTALRDIRDRVSDVAGVGVKRRHELEALKFIGNRASEALGEEVDDG